MASGCGLVKIMCQESLIQLYSVLCRNVTDEFFYSNGFIVELIHHHLDIKKVLTE